MFVHCTSRETSFFGAFTEPEISKIPIDKENLVIHKSLVSGSNRNIYDAVQWTNIHLTGVKKNQSTLIFITVVLRYGSENISHI